MPPDIIAGRYRFDREVGRGGMGSVWLCRDERLGREVAVKQVGGLPGESSMHLARALREARHSAALNHPNVVALYDALEEGDHVWLVMEYVPSRTLDEMVREDGPLPAGAAARICADVADGLAAAHALGTVHRDVKPSNILVRRDDGRALIADFGIARTVGQEQLTRSGLVTGTPVYFAPELARGQEPTPASDVWALGVSLYVAVEGNPPYPDQSNAIALLNTIASNPPPEPTRAGVLGPALERMLDRDPDTRWTMAQAAEALRELATSAASPAATAAATPATTRHLPDPVPTPTRARRPAAAAPVAPVAPVQPVERDPDPTHETRTVPAVVPVDLQPEPEPASPHPFRPDDGDGADPIDQPDRRRWPRVLLVAAVTLLALGLVAGWLLSRDDDAGDRTATSPSSAPTGDGGGEPDPATDDPAPSSGASQEPPAEEPETSGTSPEGGPAPSSATSDPDPDPGAGAGAGSATGLVTEYYSLLPDDTDTSWQLLSPELQQEVGRGSFVGFWATIDDVQVDSAEDLGDGLVQVTITYTTDGRTEQETRQLTVDAAGGGLLITDDLGPV